MMVGRMICPVSLLAVLNTPGLDGLEMVSGQCLGLMVAVGRARLQRGSVANGLSAGICVHPRHRLTSA